MTNTKLSMVIDFSDRFKKELKKTPVEIKIAFRETLELFQENPNHPFLRNHALRENFFGYRSIDITDEWRAIFKNSYSKEQKVITFHRIGTHPQLYG